MNVRSAQVQQQLRERDAELNRLRRELRVRKQWNRYFELLIHFHVHRIRLPPEMRV